MKRMLMPIAAVTFDYYSAMVIRRELERDQNQKFLIITVGTDRFNIVPVGHFNENLDR